MRYSMMKIAPIFQSIIKRWNQNKCAWDIPGLYSIMIFLLFIFAFVILLNVQWQWNLGSNQTWYFSHTHTHSREIQSRCMKINSLCWCMFAILLFSISIIMKHWRNVYCSTKWIDDIPDWYSRIAIFSCHNNQANVKLYQTESIYWQ